MHKIKEFLMRNHRIGKAACILLLLIGLYFFNRCCKHSSADFHDTFFLWPEAAVVHYIDVGQGDASLIQLPTGETMLIDAGTNESETALLAYLDNVGVRTLDYAIFTHPHEDHIGGADHVLRAYDIRRVILPDADAVSSTYERMLDSIADKDAAVFQARVGDTYRLGDASFTILGPVSSDPENLNNSSIILRFDYNGSSFLFTGDAEASAETDACNASDPSLFDVDVMKVGHHGSSTSSSDAFLAAVTPEIAIISCGKNNDYGHPHKEVLSALFTYGTSVYRTDENGFIRVYTDGETYKVTTDKGN